VCVVRNGPIPVPQCILADAPTIASPACRGSFAASVMAAGASLCRAK